MAATYKDKTFFGFSRSLRPAIQETYRVAGMFLTTECGIVDIPEPVAVAPAMPGGGMM